MPAPIYSRVVTTEVKATADMEAVVTTRRQSYVRMGDPEDRRMSLGKRRRSSAEDVWDVTMDIEEEVEYVPWTGSPPEIISVTFRCFNLR